MSWRPLQRADLPALNALAGLVHPTLPEDESVPAERLALYPDGCFALDGRAGLAGYLLSHPWRLGAPPKLNTLLQRLPDAADTYYLHDLALHPAVRGRGAADALLARILSDPRWPTHSLVAVGSSARFWHRHGFAAEPGPDVSAYGPGAAHMVRR
jgi:ribosomal protein S18 acetylase RimI-like enzyme